VLSVEFDIVVEPVIALDVDENESDMGRPKACIGEGTTTIDFRLSASSGSTMYLVVSCGGKACIGGRGGIGNCTTGPNVICRKYVVR